MKEISINEEQEKMKMNVMSIYIQDIALGSSLELPVKKKTSFSSPPQAKCRTFLTHLKS